VTTATQTQTCRLTIVAPGGRIDTSLPAGVPLVDLLPALLHHLGPELADRGLDHGGWALQKLGAAPLDEDRTVDELGLLDGDLLHLRPRADLLPPVDFDDLVDGVATGMRRRSGLWQPRFTRWATLVVAALLLLTGAAVLAAPGPVGLRVPTAWAGSLALLVAAAVTARRPAGGALALLLGGAAVAHSAAGLVAASGAFASRVPGGPGASGLPGAPGAPGAPGVSVGWVVAAGVHLALTLALAAPAVWGGGRAVGVGLGAAATCTLTAAALLGVTDAEGACAVLLCLTVVARQSVPKLAFRLAGLRLDPLPETAEDLQDRIDPVPGARLLDETARIDRLMSVLHAVLAASGVVAISVLLAGGGWPGTTVVAVAAAGQLLELRAMTSAWQRLAIGVPALAALLLAPALAAVRTPGLGPVAVDVGLLAAAGLLVPAGLALAERRLSPVPGRVGDTLQTLAGVALIPAALWALGVYGSARNWLG